MTDRWSVDPALAEAALERLRSAKRILMPTHQNIDADGLGTPLALKHALAHFGVLADVLISDGQFPSNLNFLPGIESALIYGQREVPEFDMLCMADCSDKRRLGNFYDDDPTRVNGAYPIVNIDHHVTNDHYGVVNIVVPNAASTAEIAADLVRLWNVPMSHEIAVCLLTGIYGDTLGLRTEATTARTMRTAADLVDFGANPAEITDALFRIKPASTVCLWEKALATTTWNGSLIWTEVTQNALDGCGAKPSEAEGLVNFLAGTEGSRTAAILYQVAGGWRVSLRSLSDDVDVAAIASVFGGGGHPRAAGCSITGTEADKLAFIYQLAELSDRSWESRRRE